MYETDLAFCASYKDGTKAPTESYTERMKHTQATRHDTKGVLSDKSEKTPLFGVSPLVSQLSLSGFASNLEVGPTSSLKLVSVSNFSVAVDWVNKPLHLDP